ncbi:cell wall-active antibiotics response protein [Alteribacter natronophilus]|uniref:cell wall-active antibiotics response protein n=1 Tax=Alteribacter natronophilus TaxID=2583810 RepID=UPI00110EFF00|nr:cell wall-active antibiotics response protein [Alteribacter natronophilus]TMW72910.1 hypothetical protein FGB90_00940 [Alteribacter natronophilus]
MNKFIGLIILAIGVLYLLNNTGIIDASFGQMISTYWPLIIVAIGVKMLFEGLWETYRFARRDKWRFGRLFWGAAVTSAGIVLLGNRAGWFYYTLADLWSWTWPLLIIFAGFQMLRNRSTVVVFDRDKEDEASTSRENSGDYDDESEPFDRDALNRDIEDVKQRAKEETKRAKDQVEKHLGKHMGQHMDKHVNKHVNKYASAHYEKKNRGNTEGHRGSDVERVSQFVGEVSLGRRPWKLHNTDIKTTIGAVEVDLTTAVLKDGVNYLDIDVFIGAVEVTVPKDMAIKVHARANVGEASLFGDSGSGTYTSVNFDDAVQKVVLNVKTNIGAVEVMAVD